MGKIKILDDSVSNMISAGEVVENPASMIKELLENSLDAESKQIEIIVSNGGRNVKISDDGIGMNREDLFLSVERHATSKISKKDDLFNLYTYGFRGEALSSIAAVSKLKISSKTKEEAFGNYITISGGKVTGINEDNRGIGTTIEIKNLFFNTPARLKFLRKPATEYANIKDIIIKEALANPNIGISLIIDGKISIKTSGNGIENTIVEIFGANTLNNMKSFENGFLGNAALYRSNKDMIFTFVNNRTVKSKILQDAIIDGYYTKLMKGRYPFAILFLEINPKEVDVNVHPSKKIVKFSNEDEIYKMVLEKIEKSFKGDDDFVSPTLERKTEKKKERFLDFSDFEVFEEKENSKELQKFGKQESLKIPEKFEEFEKQENFEVSENFKKFEIEENLKIPKEKKEISEISEKKKYVEKFEKEKKPQNFRVIGQVFDTFILVERDGIFEIYDQHIVHERILYEKLKAIYYSGNTSSQNLLMPIKILVTPKEMVTVLKNIEEFQKAGFEIDRFGDRELLIRAIPNIKMNDSVENIFRDMIISLEEKRYRDIKENILISMSCKGAIKANQKLSNEEMEKMVAKLHEIGEYTCPHGRPILIKITLNDLEKLFKRK